LRDKQDSRDVAFIALVLLADWKVANIEDLSSEWIGMKRFDGLAVHFHGVPAHFLHSLNGQLQHQS
jgi:hypothetical protein